MYRVRFYKGDLLARQTQANRDGCVAYIEHHFNSSENAAANYAVALTGSNASQTSRNWGRWYAQAVAREFGIPVGGDQGIKVGGYDGRGDFNLRFTSMPAILLEPLFASNPMHADWIRSETGQMRMAQILCDSVQRFFQQGGLIGFSVGHKYKETSPHDRGAPIHGGGMEADFAEKVLERTKVLLESIHEPVQQREILVVQGSQVLWRVAVDPDAVIGWDPVRGTLRISDTA
jgi:hypothetical protein